MAQVATLGIERSGYRAWFTSDPFDDFGRELTALLDAGLLREEGERLALTPEGMFYGDTIAGTLAWRQVQSMRAVDLIHPSTERLSYDEALDESLWNPMG